MKNNNLLPFIITVLILLVAIIVAVIFEEETVSAYGSIIAASGSVIAILWFTIGLRKDIEQQKIQNQQFSYNFEKILEQGRRESLLVVKSILDDAEQKIVASDQKNLLQKLFSDFLQPFDYQTLYTSKNAQMVSSLSQEWIERMGPGYQIIRSIKTAGSVYLKSINSKNSDYNYSLHVN